MKTLLTALLCITLFSTAQAQSILPDVVEFDHAWVKGLYWNRGELPGWGFFVDVQEETMFGAVYGYENNEPRFVVLLGSVDSTNPLVFKGDVYYVIEPGVREEDVGNFQWVVDDHEASPAAKLTITSNILNRTNLLLVRTSYVETDKVDMLTGGDWNIITRLLSISFGDHYTITDMRVDQDGKTYAGVFDAADPEKIGVVSYFPPGEGDAYGMLVPFTDTSNAFYVFYANNTNMYGRYWLLDDGESPSGNGYYFQGSAATMQEPYPGANNSVQSTARVEAVQSNDRIKVTAQVDLKALRISMYSNSKELLYQQFSEQTVQMVFEELSAIIKSSESKVK